MTPRAVEVVTDPHEPDVERFYEALPELTEFADVIQADLYAVAPPSSVLVLTDVIGSTKAIEAGRYRDVNALGVASIVAVCNAMRDVEVPFVFGGDGATLLVPGTRRRDAECALRGVRALASSAFDLGLRASVIPLAALAREGHVARVARLCVSQDTTLAMFSGSAFSAAERWFKDPARGPVYDVSADGPSYAEFDGFECRWQPLKSRRGQSVSLIVRALGATEQERSATYKRILRMFDELVDINECHPVKESNLKATGVFGDYSIEARVRSGAAAGPSHDAAFRHARSQTLIGRFLTATGTRAGDFDGRMYKRDLATNCDFRKFDDTLRMVVDLDASELAQLRAVLEDEQRTGALAYGLHASDSSLVTCLVRSYRGDHVHFVDGGGGGYALAARALKRNEVRRNHPSGT